MTPQEFTRLFQATVGPTINAQNAMLSGTTAQRPTSPVPGARYFDTTLAAAGKPIWWRPPNWVDSTGAIV